MKKNDAFSHAFSIKYQRYKINESRIEILEKTTRAV